MDHKLSIIVPIYNVEEYLPRCIDSILAQTFTDFELLLVDDGSTDNCPQICDEYAIKDARIVVIHQINSGVSNARNTALKNARGKYIAFVDGDDFIIPDAYEHMLREMETYGLDILTGRCCRLHEGDIEKTASKKCIFENIVYSGIDFFCLRVKQGVMKTGCWLSIYDKSFLLNNSLFFKQGILHEDELWTPQVFLKAKRVKFIDLFFYMYVCRPDSIMNAKDKTQNGIDLINICYELELLYAQVSSEKQRRILNDFLLDTFLFAVFMGKLYRPDYRHLLKREFVWGKALTVKNRAKAGLFWLNPQVFAKAAELKGL